MKRVFNIGDIAKKLNIPSIEVEGPGGVKKTQPVWNEADYQRVIKEARAFAAGGGDVEFVGHEKGWFASGIAYEFKKGGCCFYSNIQGNITPMCAFEIGIPPAEQGVVFDVSEVNGNVYISIAINRDPGPVALAAGTIVPDVVSGKELFITYKGHGLAAVGTALAHADKFERVFVRYEPENYICVISSNDNDIGTVVV